MNRRYIASLAVAAILTLAAGLVIRRTLRRAELSPPAVVAPTEASALQLLSQEGQARRLSSFLGDRATNVAALVEYVPASRASGLRWRNGDTLITTFPDRPVVAIHAPRGDTTRIPSIAPSDSMRGEWALLVGRRPDGGVVSLAGVVGGRLTTICADHEVTEYVLGVSLPEGFAGAGLFDLAGRAIGIVARCGSRLVALPASEVGRLVAAADSLGGRLRMRFGFASRPLDDAARSYFRTDSGMLVTEVAGGTPAALAGWMPGDVITRIDGVPVASSFPQPVIDSLVAADSHTVVIRRGGALRSTALSRLARVPDAGASGDLGIALAAPSSTAAVISDVRPGSAAANAGLRSGDRLIRVGSTSVRSMAEAQRLLDRLRSDDSVVFLVFVRDSVARGALVRR